MFDCDEAGYLKIGFNAKIQVFTSREFTCTGAVGGLAALAKKGGSLAQQDLSGERSQWLAGSVDKNSTMGFFFDITTANKSDNPPPPNQNAYLQFHTTYL